MPGCDPVVAGSARGPFALVDDLCKLGGLGPRTAAPACGTYRANDPIEAADVRMLALALRIPCSLRTWVTNCLNAGRCRYAAVSHEPETVLLVDKVLAWSVGEHYHAEVDICLPPESASCNCKLQLASVDAGDVSCHVRFCILLFACCCDLGRVVCSATEPSARHRRTVGGADRNTARYARSWFHCDDKSECLFVRFLRLQISSGAMCTLIGKLSTRLNIKARTGGCSRCRVGLTSRRVPPTP